MVCQWWWWCGGSDGVIAVAAIVVVATVVAVVAVIAVDYVCVFTRFIRPIHVAVMLLLVCAKRIAHGIKE